MTIVDNTGGISNALRVFRHSSQALRVAEIQFTRTDLVVVESVCLLLAGSVAANLFTSALYVISKCLVYKLVTTFSIASAIYWVYFYSRLQFNFGAAANGN